MKKLLLAILLCCNCFNVLSVPVSASNNEVSPYYLVTTVNVNETHTEEIVWVDSFTRGTVKFKITGSYEVKDFGTSRAEILDYDLKGSLISAPSDWTVSLQKVKYEPKTNKIVVTFVIRYSAPYYDSVSSYPITTSFSYSV